MSGPGLDQPLRFCPGIGPARAAVLAAIGAERLGDILYLPCRCLDPAPDEVTDGPLPKGVPVQVRARVRSISYRPFGRRRSLVVQADTAAGRRIHARFFNAGYLRSRFIAQEWFLFEGRSDAKLSDTLNHPRFTHLQGGDQDDRAARSGCAVAYRLPEGVSQRLIDGLVDLALAAPLAGFVDPAAELSPADWRETLRQLHRPADPATHAQARQQLAWRELLAFAWVLQRRRAAITATPRRPWRWSDAIHRRALDRLPFSLTPGQTAAVAAIRQDLQGDRPMYRLLQGDVGCGKTAVALLAALAVIADGAQVLLLAPTAILAEQHARFVAAQLTGSRVRWLVLTGDRARDPALQQTVAAGEADLVIGTHALLNEAVRPPDLGLAIIDEQHKFGVAQRGRLVAKAGDRPVDLLLLSATPIPRSLALALFGDLAISRIADKPPGRQPVQTSIQPWRRSLVLDLLRRCLATAGRAFLVTALKAESDQVAAIDAAELHRDLSGVLGDDLVGLLHGDLDDDAKSTALGAFRDGSRPVLITTTVVEVGVDVPEADLLVVCNAERFGLAQLHQLRGRIGRGDRPGQAVFCHAAEADVERLAILAQSDDGLAIAEADLARRGPGDLLGRRQHGVPEFRWADLSTQVDDLIAAQARVDEAVAAGRSPPADLLRRFTVATATSDTTIAG